MRSVAAALLLLLAACSSGPEPEPASSSSTTATSASTTTSTTTARPPTGLSADWQRKYDAISDGAPFGVCSPAASMSTGCKDHLTEIVTTTLELERAIEARPDSSRYHEVLAKIDAVLQESSAYAACAKRADPAEECVYVTMVMAPVTIMLALRTAEIG